MVIETGNQIVPAEVRRAGSQQVNGLQIVSPCRAVSGASRRNRKQGYVRHVSVEPDMSVPLGRIVTELARNGAKRTLPEAGRGTRVSHASKVQARFNRQ